MLSGTGTASKQDGSETLVATSHRHKRLVLHNMYNSLLRHVDV